MIVGGKKGKGEMWKWKWSVKSDMGSPDVSDNVCLTMEGGFNVVYRSRAPSC